MAESFFAALKNERVHRTQYPTREHARRDVVRYIEFWYNEVFSAAMNPAFAA
jgi:putative transposase